MGLAAPAPGFAQKGNKSLPSWLVESIGKGSILRCKGKKDKLVVKDHLFYIYLFNGPRDK
jgi:hypothetical protein